MHLNITSHRKVRFTPRGLRETCCDGVAAALAWQPLQVTQKHEARTARRKSDQVLQDWIEIVSLFLHYDHEHSSQQKGNIVVTPSYHNKRTISIL
jgi:hypothetical protein